MVKPGDRYTINSSVNGKPITIEVTGELSAYCIVGDGRNWVTEETYNPSINTWWSNINNNWRYLGNFNKSKNFNNLYEVLK